MLRRHAPPLCPTPLGRPHPALLYPRPGRRRPIAAVRDGDQAAPTTAFPVPSFLPSATRALLPSARRYAAHAARRYRVPLTDCWDEAVTALLRATIYFRPGPGSFHAYATTAVRRGLWRYCRRPSRPTVSLDTVPPAALPDVETLLIALEDGLQPAHGRHLPALKQAAP